ncbi:hypothetical protein M0R45_014235 [Rubus argutus]|uniref:Uncharacterized protein n=1 Tax=Rubus argutus TaxID=59490 RepID=A0AAW1XLM3_RUBAR
MLFETPLHALRDCTVAAAALNTVSLGSLGSLQATHQQPTVRCWLTEQVSHLSPSWCCGRFGETVLQWFGQNQMSIFRLGSGMKVGVHRRNGHIWSVSSWSSLYVPAPGPFTLDWDPNGRELKIKRRGVVY